MMVNLHCFVTFKGSNTVVQFSSMGGETGWPKDDLKKCILSSVIGLDGFLKVASNLHCGWTMNHSDSIARDSSWSCSIRNNKAVDC